MNEMIVELLPSRYGKERADAEIGMNASISE